MTSIWIFVHYLKLLTTDCHLDFIWWWSLNITEGGQSVSKCEIRKSKPKKRETTQTLQYMYFTTQWDKMNPILWTVNGIAGNACEWKVVSWRDGVSGDWRFPKEMNLLQFDVPKTLKDVPRATCQIYYVNILTQWQITCLENWAISGTSSLSLERQAFVDVESQENCYYKKIKCTF